LNIGTYSKRKEYISPRYSSSSGVRSQTGHSYPDNYKKGLLYAKYLSIYGSFLSSSPAMHLSHSSFKNHLNFNFIIFFEYESYSPTTRVVVICDFGHGFYLKMLPSLG
jgi:hypothetical protein